MDVSAIEVTLTMGEVIELERAKLKVEFIERMLDLDPVTFKEIVEAYLRKNETPNAERLEQMWNEWIKGE